MIHLYACNEAGEVLEYCAFVDWFETLVRVNELRKKHCPADIYHYDESSKFWYKYYWKTLSPLVSLGTSHIGLSQVPNTVRTLHMLEAE